ncbi:accessory gland protein Acp29AB-like [Drosophila subpulchrella]|uniref:accessory gland protein Acp29AB-like n=1 Tax=Drosophila subpulchrella TaxID=1486046 RepID=UPI0018A188C1|nr:accessory gland protein Acp29AB-like [Drosophila subpulchrella]
MVKSKTFILFAFTALDIIGSLAEDQNARRFVCLLSDPPNQCSAYCVSALQPVINHITKEQQDSNTYELKLNETQAKLDLIKNQLTTTQIQMKDQQIFLQTNLTQSIPQDLKERLDRIEGNQTLLAGELQAIKSTTKIQLTAMQDTLSKVDRRTMLQNYQRIGTRLFYIEHNLYVNWWTANTICAEIGGHLAAFKNDQEFNGIAKQLKQENYWLGISDPKQKGDFKSVATGKRAPYFKWRSNEPNYRKFGRSDEHCVYVYGVRNYMIVLSCTKDLMHFICQADKDV